MAARGNREEIVIATKVGMAKGLEGLSAETIARACEGSLERLGIERIDLYYAHRDDPGTPLEETLRAFAGLIEEGRISHAAASNYSPARLEQALEAGRAEGLASYVALQPHYNLLERSEYEGELAGVVERHGLACLPYYGLARGFLSGKYRRDGAPSDSPRAQSVRDAYMNERGFAALDVVEEIAAAHATSLAAVALAWLAAQPTVVAPIASATSVAQLAELTASAELELSAAELQALTAAGS
jgi:aryl-alcohol dehydrogenase-like predicted oxidoreductase